MKLHFPNTIFKQHHHSHGLMAALNALDQRPVVSLLHVLAVDGKYYVARPHPRSVRWAILVHVVHVGQQLDFSVLTMVNSVSLRGKKIDAEELLIVNMTEDEGGQLPPE